MNCSDTIDISLSYKHIGHNSTKTFGSTKVIFPLIFIYTKFLITLLLHIILKITIGYYKYNINSQLLSVKF